MVDPMFAPLPRGRHNLSRDEVVQSQRLRLMVSIADAMTEKGYVGTSVADVLKRAGVSRETFYQQFTSKLDCFLHAFDLASEVLLTRVQQAISQLEGPPLERFDQAFAAYIDVLLDQPAMARVFLVEGYAAGPEAMQRRAEGQARIVDGLVELLAVASDEDRFACEVLVAAVGSMVTGPLLSGDAKELYQLQDNVVGLVRRFFVDHAEN